MKLLKFSVNFQILRQNFSFKNLIKVNLICTRFLETHQGTLKVKTNQNRWIVDKLPTISDQQPPSWFRVADSRTGASISRCKIQCQTLKKCRPKEPTISRNAVNRLKPTNRRILKMFFAVETRAVRERLEINEKNA